MYYIFEYIIFTDKESTQRSHFIKYCQFNLNLKRWPKLNIKVYKMKIAQISPLYESVPPKFYGGTGGGVAYFLTDDIYNSIYYISGPIKMVEIIKNILLNMDINKDYIKTDYFPGYND